VTLDPKVQVELPAEGVTVRRSGDRQTVYKVIRSYRDNKGHPNNDRVVIGKLDPATGKLIPNARYWHYYGGSQAKIDVNPDYQSIRSIGGSFLIHYIMTSQGISKILVGCLGSERASLVQTAALYMATRGNVFEGVLDYCEEYTLWENPLSSPSALELFASITFDERFDFFKEWVAKQNPLNYLAYDVTSFSTRSKDISDSEFGYNRDGEKIPQINLGCFLSENTSLPIFYVTYPGSIVDKSHLKYMMAYNNDLGIYDVIFILDRGFCSTANIRYLASNHHKFIIGVEKQHKTTMIAIDFAKKTDIVAMQNRAADGVYGIALKGRFYGVKGTMYIYYSPELAECHRKDLYRLIESHEEKLVQLKTKTTEAVIKPYKKYFSIYLNEDNIPVFSRDYKKINALEENCGYFCIFSNTSLDISELLSRYRKKDAIEKGFDDIKNHIEMKRLRTHHTETTDGKLFCSFISLIVVSEINTKLRTLMRKKGWSKSSVIKELEKIKTISFTDGIRLLNPITKVQRSILDAFGIGEKEISSYICRNS
jgi:transposase